MDSPAHRPHHQHSVDRIVQLEAQIADLLAAGARSKTVLDELHNQVAVREERLELARYAALEEAERAELLANELESIFQQIPLALLVVNNDGAILRANKAAEVLLGWRMDAMLLGSIKIACSHDHAAATMMPIAASVNEEIYEPSVFALYAAVNDAHQATLCGSDGLERTVNLFATEVLTARGCGYLLVLEALADPKTLSV